MKTVLVFGASGFMGSYLIDTLINEGFSVIGADIAKPITSIEYRFFKIDITNKEDFKKIEDLKIDVVVHLAACQPANVSDKNFDPRSYLNVNAIGTQNILEFCKESKINKVIYGMSHRNTQGLWNCKKSLSEDDGIKIDFNTEYTLFSISETTAQNLFEYYSTQFGLNSIIFRFPPVYGYGPHTEIFKNGKPIKTGFQIFIDNAAECKPLQVWGDAEAARDIVYIKDVISAFTAALRNDSVTGLFNISSGKKLSLIDEVTIIADVFWGDSSLPVIEYITEKDNKIDSFCYDIKKAKEELGWEPKYSFEDMLYDFIKESGSKRFEHLIKKRQDQLTEYNQ